MSFSHGTFSMKRLFILQKDVKLDVSDVVERLHAFSIHPLDVDDTREYASGFCHPVTGNPKIESPQSLLFDQGLYFGFRQDSKKVPGTLLKIHYRSALASLGLNKEEEGASKDKKQKEAVRDRVKTELVKHALPHIRMTEILWFLDSQEIYFFSNSQSVFQEFEKVFFEAFRLPYTTLTPGVMGVDLDEIVYGSGQVEERLFDVRPVEIDFLSEVEEEKNSVDHF